MLFRRFLTNHTLFPDWSTLIFLWPPWAFRVAFLVAGLKWTDFHCPNVTARSPLCLRPRLCWCESTRVLRETKRSKVFSLRLQSRLLLTYGGRACLNRHPLVSKRSFCLCSHEHLYRRPDRRRDTRLMLQIAYVLRSELSLRTWRMCALLMVAWCAMTVFWSMIVRWNEMTSAGVRKMWRSEQCIFNIWRVYNVLTIPIFVFNCTLILFGQTKRNTLRTFLGPNNSCMQIFTPICPVGFESLRPDIHKYKQTSR